MYQLIYDETKEALVQINPSGQKTVIADNFPSRPEYSPDKTKAIYISPLEWECPGSLYLFNLESGCINELVSTDDNLNTPKYAIWIDDKTIALIIGFGWGTSSIGGNVFTYNIDNKDLNQITHFSEKIQITKLDLNGESIELYGIKFIDDDYIEFKEYEDTISLNEVL